MVVASYRPSTLDSQTMFLRPVFAGAAPRFGGALGGAAKVKPRSLARLLSSQAGTSLPPPGPDSGWWPSKYRYVDKSLMQAELLFSSPAKYSLLPAMRRVGKSTTLRQLAAMARGEKDKFKGYAVTAPDSPYKIELNEFSVIQLDFSRLANGLKSAEDVEEAVIRYVCSSAKSQHGVELRNDLLCVGEALREWMNALGAKEDKRPIVVLIDEYDAPITSLVLTKGVAEAELLTEKMSTLYGELKAREPDLHKVFVAGVAKVSSMNMYSGANVLRSLFEVEPRFCTLFGFTRAEILETYGDVPVNGGKKQLRERMDDLAEWYNGYRVHPEQTDEDALFNPWSVLSFMMQGKREAYWTSTTSIGLNELLLRRGPSILAGVDYTWSQLKAPRSIGPYVEDQHWMVRAFQAGYLTIKNAKPVVRANRMEDYDLQLRVPNAEVETWLTEETYALFAPGASFDAYANAIVALDFELAGEQLQQIFDALKEPRERIQNEAAFSFLALGSLAQRTKTHFEVVLYELVEMLPNDLPKARKRSDGVLVFNVKGERHMLVAEVKFGKSADDALKQIKDNKYCERALQNVKKRDPSIVVDPKNVHLVGLNLTYSADGKPVVTLKEEKYEVN